MIRFLVDECVGPEVFFRLADLRHEVAAVRLDNPGMADPEVLRQSVAENRILITCDKDYGNLVFERKLPHVGIVLLRIPDARAGDKIAALLELLELYPQDLVDNFVVTTRRKIRFAETENPRPDTAG